jgi:hypothetical protein
MNKVQPKKPNKIVQMKNPKTGRYVKVNKTKGTIIRYKQTPGPYKNVPIARTRKAQRGN